MEERRREKVTEESYSHVQMWVPVWIPKGISKRESQISCSQRHFGTAICNSPHMSEMKPYTSQIMANLSPSRHDCIACHDDILELLFHEVKNSVTGKPLH